VNYAFLKLPLHDLIRMASEAFAISDSHFQHMYAIPHSRSGQLIIMWPIKMFLNGGKNGRC
jgi:hypothetical protein